MADKKIYDLHSEVCKALGHPLHLEVIDILRTQEMCFTDILEITGGLKSNLSQHLSVMTKRGILNARRAGQCTYFSLSSPKVAQACTLLREVLVENMKEQQKVLENI